MLFHLGSYLQLLQAVIPQAFEVLAQLGEPLGACAIEALCAGAALGDQAGDLEHAQVLRHTGPRDREMLGDAPGGHLGAGDDPQDVAPRRITESFHEVVHGPIVSISLRKCQVTRLLGCGLHVGRRNTTLGHRPTATGWDGAPA